MGKYALFLIMTLLLSQVPASAAETYTYGIKTDKLYTWEVTRDITYPEKCKIVFEESVEFHTISDETATATVSIEYLQGDFDVYSEIMDIDVYEGYTIEETGEVSLAEVLHPFFLPTDESYREYLEENNDIKYTETPFSYIIEDSESIFSGFSGNSENGFEIIVHKSTGIVIYAHQFIYDYDLDDYYGFVTLWELYETREYKGIEILAKPSYTIISVLVLVSIVLGTGYFLKRKNLIFKNNT